MNFNIRKKKKIILRKRFFVFLLILIALIVFTVFSFQQHKKQQLIIHNAIEKAELAAVQYDYDKALSILEEYEDNKEVQEKIDSLSQKKADTKTVSIDSITHVFFHSLVVDPSRGFSLTGKTSWDVGTPGFCQWMTTMKEYKAMLNEMYKNNYVLVDLKDVCDKDMNPGKIRLPKGKKAFVLSLDDLSYYHTYDNRGTASKIVLNENHQPVCEYYTKNGKKKIGDYDALPILDRFIEEHPDFSYRGAKGTIALTGYNGVLGYRTDTTYRDKTNLDKDQEEWLNEHPNFNWKKECQEAEKVAKAIKKDGWRFASHTWGHVRAGQIELEGLQRDTQKWKERVEPIIGKTDIIIFAHGEDIAIPEQYTSSEKFKYLYSEGFRYFCNVDGRLYTTLIGKTYFHQGRRNLDGYRLYEAKYNGHDRLSDLFDVDKVWDEERPSSPELYDLGGNNKSSTSNNNSTGSTSSSTNKKQPSSNQSQTESSDT